MADLNDLTNAQQATADPTRLNPLLAKLAETEREMEAMDERWKVLKETKRRIEEEDLPTLMDELGIQSVKIGEYDVKVDDDWRASIPKYRKDATIAYAESIGLGDLVSQKVVQEFKKNEQDMFEAAIAILNEHQQLFYVDRDMNTGSWKKAIRELIAAGKPVDLEAACVTKVRKAIIKASK